MNERDFTSGNWDTFESWIRGKVGGEFFWKIRPRDTALNRRVVAESVVETIEKNGGSFPSSGNLYLERRD